VREGAQPAGSARSWLSDRHHACYAVAKLDSTRACTSCNLARGFSETGRLTSAPRPGPARTRTPRGAAAAQPCTRRGHRDPGLRAYAHRERRAFHGRWSTVAGCALRGMYRIGLASPIRCMAWPRDRDLPGGPGTPTTMECERVPRPDNPCSSAESPGTMAPSSCGLAAFAAARQRPFRPTRRVDRAPIDAHKFRLKA